MGILSKLIPGVAGRNVSLYGWPMLAVGIDPGGSPQPVAVDADGKVILDGSITVPSGIPIAPDQAFVTGMAQLLVNFEFGFDFANIGATSFTSDGGAQLQALLSAYNAFNGTATYDYSNNAVMGPTLLDEMFQAHIEANTQNSIIDTSGGTNAAVAQSKSEIFTLMFPASPINTTRFRITLAGRSLTYFIHFDDTIPVASSYEDFSTPAFRIGILDNPTPAYMVEKFVILITGQSVGEAMDNANGTVTISDGNPAALPYSFADEGSGVTYLENQQGVVGNILIASLLANGNTVNTN